ncbi:MAG: SDR family oxidoreductase [Phycisphaerales bacterium]|nr:SDR family oxidoreductase [Phycisphaerales bacterium]
MNRNRWLITGAAGQLGGHVLRALREHSPTAAVLALTRPGGHSLPGVDAAAIDLANHIALAAAIDEFRPTHVLHLGGVTAVGDAWRDPQRATAVNTDATRMIAECAGKLGARVVFSSTDMVFSGENAPYDEDDAPAPLSQYGKSKAAAEQAVRDLPGVIAVRLPLMYGFPATQRDTTFIKQVAAMRAGEPLNLFTDEYRTPIALTDAAQAVIALATSEITGLIHVAGPERLSRYDMGARFAAALGNRAAQLVPTSRLSIEAAEPRAEDLSLVGDRFNDIFPHHAPRPITARSLGTPPI